MNSALRAFLALPKIIWINLRYLPFKQAIKFPILLTYSTNFKCVKGGKVRLDCSASFGMIHIGFHAMNVCNPYDITIVEIRGVLVFRGKANLGRGTKITIYKGCEMVLGDRFNVSGYSSFVCKKRMVFGNNVLFGWECLTMDGDGHKIYDEQNMLLKNTSDIIIADNVWIGCRCMILKGSAIPKGCVIGAGTTIAGQLFEANNVIAGNPPHAIRKVSKWEM